MRNLKESVLLSLVASLNLATAQSNTSNYYGAKTPKVLENIANNNKSLSSFPESELVVIVIGVLIVIIGLIWFLNLTKSK